MSEAHLFPQSIGGRLAFKHCCKHCNGWLGHDLESKLLKSLFVAFGREKLQIATKAGAFRDIQIVDPATGEDYKYVGDELVGKAKMRSPSERVAPPGELRRLIRKDVRKRFPNWEEEYLRQYDSGAERIGLPSEEHIFRVEKSKGPVEFRSQEFFPIDVLAKICYEVMFLFGPFTLSTLSNYYASTFTVYRSASPPFRTRVSIKGDFKRRVRMWYPTWLSDNIDYSNIHYAPWHSIDMRVNPQGIAYIIVSFFGALRYQVLIETTERANLRSSQFLDKRLVFPIGEGPLAFATELSEKYKDIREAEDAFAGVAWEVYTTGRLSIVESPEFSEHDQDQND